jgi:hypothetical protein
LRGVSPRFKGQPRWVSRTPEYLNESVSGCQKNLREEGLSPLHGQRVHVGVARYGRSVVGWETFRTGTSISVTYPAKNSGTREIPGHTPYSVQSCVIPNSLRSYRRSVRDAVVPNYANEDPHPKACYGKMKLPSPSQAP